MNAIDQQTFSAAVRTWLVSKGVDATAEGPFTLEEMDQIRGILTFEYGVSAAILPDALYLPGMFSHELMREIMDSYNGPDTVINDGPPLDDTAPIGEEGQDAETQSEEETPQNGEPTEEPTEEAATGGETPVEPTTSGEESEAEEVLAEEEAAPDEDKADEASADEGQ